jgi:N-acyl-L-homoserine lactone synthetase
MLAKTEANQGKIMTKLLSHHERMMARMNFQLKKVGAALTTNQEEVNVTDLDANPEEIKS